MQLRSNLQKSFDDNAKEEIRSLINIADVVGRHVALKPAGQNFKGLCPFHKEKTPSFTVSPDKGIFYCFGCHKGGDVFTFLMELEGLTFPETIRMLADEAGIKLAPPPQQKNQYAPESPEPQETQTQGISKVELYQINDLAMTFYYNQTRNHKNAIDYFLSRGLTRETIRDFKLGYAPNDWTGFLNFAKSKRISEASVVAAGLAVAKQDTGRVYDRFRDRIIFPIFDSARRPIGFGGRGMTKDAVPKYLNSPETPLYQKSKVMYGFHASYNAIRESKSAIIVEGYMDFLSLFQAGIHNVIASSGTAFTDTQAKTLRRFTATLYLVFDGDSAGIEAARRAITILVPYSFDIRVLTIPNDEDPDDFVKQNGAKGFLELLDKSKNYMQFIVEKTIVDTHANTPHGKSAALAELTPLLLATTDVVVQREFIKLVGESLGLPTELIYKRLKETNTSPAVTQKQEVNDIVSYFGSMEGIFIWILLTEPALIADAKQFILPETFSDQFSGKLYSILLDVFNNDPSLKSLIGVVDDDGIKRVISYAYANVAPVTAHRDDLFHLMKRLQIKYLSHMENETRRKMATDPKNSNSLLEKIKEYYTQRKALSDT